MKMTVLDLWEDVGPFRFVMELDYENDPVRLMGRYVYICKLVSFTKFVQYAALEVYLYISMSLN